MARPSSNMRLFIGVYPPQDVAQSMLDHLSKLSLPAHRTTPIEQIHLTVLFIGDTPARNLDPVIESVHRAASGVGAFTLEPEHMVALPDRGAPRLVALTTSAPPQLLELRHRLVTRFAKSSRSRPNDRFLPHFTLCRFAPGAVSQPTRDALTTTLNQPCTLPPFPVHRLSLMRSTLSPSGARHHCVEVIQL